MLNSAKGCPPPPGPRLLAPSGSLPPGSHGGTDSLCPFKIERVHGMMELRRTVMAMTSGDDDDDGYDEEDEDDADEEEDEEEEEWTATGTMMVMAISASWW